MKTRRGCLVFFIDIYSFLFVNVMNLLSVSVKTTNNPLCPRSQFDYKENNFCNSYREKNHFYRPFLPVLTGPR